MIDQYAVDGGPKKTRGKSPQLKANAPIPIYIPPTIDAGQGITAQQALQQVKNLNIENPQLFADPTGRPLVLLTSYERRINLYLCVFSADPTRMPSTEEILYGNDYDVFASLYHDVASQLAPSVYCSECLGLELRYQSFLCLLVTVIVSTYAGSGAILPGLDKRYADAIKTRGYAITDKAVIRNEWLNELLAKCDEKEVRDITILYITS